MTLHRRSLNSTLVLSVLLFAVAAAGQNPDMRNRFPNTQPCAVRTPYSQGCEPPSSTWNQSSQLMTPQSPSQSRWPFYSTTGYDQLTDRIGEYPAYRPAPAAANHVPAELEVKELEPTEQEQKTVPHANPDAPDPSELLKNSKDPDFILRNFKTMYIELRGIDLFGPAQIKAELGKNKDFQKLNIHIVDDPRVADAVLVVRYTFAWDYPFELRHQNSTIVLLSGKGEGPFSGPLGAWDVARQFVNAAKPWRVPVEQKKPAEQKK